MQSLFKMFLLVMLLIISGTVSGKDRFEHPLTLDRDGIKVYFYSHKDFKFGTFKAITYINAPLASVLAVMFDTHSGVDWIHNCIKSFVLDEPSFDERYHYQVLDIPFPFKDRDFIFHSTLTQNPENKTVTIITTTVSDFCHNNHLILCEKINQADLVRVNVSIGVYKLESDGKGTKMTWTQHTDPAGNLPKWLVNQFVTDVPYRTLKNLAEKVKEDKYKDARLIYNAEGIAIALATPVEKPAKEAKDFDVYPSF